MMIWRNKTKGDDKVIAYFNTTIYKGSPTDDQVDAVIQELKSQKSASNDMIGIPQSYLKEVNLEEGKNYIEILFGKDSTEHLKITDDNKRKEIFEYLKANIPNSRNYIDTYSKVRAGKKPLIAMAVIAGLFLYSFLIAQEIEAGTQYEAAGGIGGIVLGVALLGVKYVILIFGLLFTIAIFSFVQKTKKPKVVNKIVVSR